MDELVDIDGDSPGVFRVPDLTGDLELHCLARQ
jgi:hypothetical protein